MAPPSARDRVCWVWRSISLRWAYMSNMSLLLGLESFHMQGVGDGWWWWCRSKGILEFRFGPNLELGT